MVLTSHVYKRVDGVEICADVHTLAGAPIGRTTRAVILWIHGGALIQGTRAAIQPFQLQRYLKAGYAVVCIDHRLAPEVKIQDILSDTLDALAWVRSEGPGLFGADPARVAVVGHSSGGYLALSLGHLASPRPRSVVSFYGYGNIDGDWYARQSAHHGREGMYTREQAWQHVYQGVLTSTAPGDDRRTVYYKYLRQNGLWPREVTGLDPASDRAAFAALNPAANVTSDYPPAFLLHGDQDRGVPATRSAEMAIALMDAGVPTQLSILQGVGHGFDKTGKTLGQVQLDGIFDEVIGFLDRHNTAKEGA